ncbi:LysO family transporter [Haliangium ochraceum]|uniref:DUF340 domain-containing protein n=1 Tax=Haliangium ochraceum (strain DSM 14365 / JCM 11303 / SMP-2) TaxID=502025 RepID=D0LS93_HALO1|nr:LysO family transporter [Haliangium ochraceum]ACY15592.1 hypothetical protein Hoch_3086 [Haliangium ochraceum DSM 14365]
MTTTIVVLICAFAGLVLGFVCQRQPRLLTLAERANMPILLLLLFLFGYELGTNQSVMGKLLAIGGQALLVITPAIIGSLLGAVLVTKLLRRRTP